MISYSQQRGECLEERLAGSALYFREAYGKQPISVRYDTPYHGYTYLYKYATLHGEIIDHALKSCDAVQKMWTEDTLIHVSSFGGGPGSELLGLARFLTETQQSRQIHYVNYDRESQWEMFFPTMCAQVSSCYPVRITDHQVHFDIIQRGELPEYVQHADLFFFNYVLTELYSCPRTVHEFLNRLARSAKAGSLFVIVDNGYGDYIGYLKSLVQEMDLSELAFDTINEFKVESPKENLEQYGRLFVGNEYPLWKMKVSYHICQKQEGRL